MKGIIFDVDGTLWDSTEMVAVAWNKVIKDEGIEHKELEEKDLKKEFGKPMEAIGESLFPEMPKDEMMKLMEKMLKYENGLVAAGPCVIFEGVQETIKKLSEKYPLYIVSNCQDGYIEAFIKAHHMEKYFEDTECWGRTRLSKGESNKILIARNHLKNPIYVGDTAGDYQSAVDAGIPFVYAAYGFGEVQDCAYEIQSIRELPEVLEQVNENKK